MKILTGSRHNPSVITHLGLDFQGSSIVTTEEQEQTRNTFSFKWSLRESYESKESQARLKHWLFEKYCDGDAAILDTWLAGGNKTILDAGCGSGFSALLFFEKHLDNNDYVGIDISDSIETAKIRFEEQGFNKYIFAQSSISDLPIQANSIDLIFSEGVLHHTDSTEQSMRHLARALKPGGYFLFYVYKEKSAIREFTDDYIRNALKDMNDEQVWEALKPLTKLGIALGELNVKVDVPEIPFLGIQAGEYDVQRLLYWHVMKMFYEPTYNIEEMNHINYDWYRPMNCHRHTPEEVKKWCKKAGLDIERFCVQNSGITVVARRPF